VESCGLDVEDLGGKRDQGPFGTTENGSVEELEDDVREVQGLGRLGHYKYAYIVPDVAIRDSQPGQSFVELRFFERASEPYREVNLCAFPLPASLRTQVVDKVSMMGISCVFLSFLPFCPVSFL